MASESITMWPQISPEEQLQYERCTRLMELLRSEGNAQVTSRYRLEECVDIVETFSFSTGLDFDQAARILMALAFDIQAAHRSFWIHRFKDTLEDDPYAPTGQNPHATDLKDLYGVRVAMIQQYTGVDETHAIVALRKSRWVVEKALACVYSDPTAQPTLFVNDLDLLFAQYQDMQTGKINLRGPPFFSSVILPRQPTEAFKVIAILSWYMQAECFGEVSLREFVVGMLYLRTDNMQDLQDRLFQIGYQLRIPEVYEKVYESCFVWFAGRDQWRMSTSQAICLWTMLFDELDLEPDPEADRVNMRWPLRNDWFRYLRRNPSAPTIDKTTWMHILKFATVIKPDLSNYDDVDWPFLIKDFVDELITIKTLSPDSPDSPANLSGSLELLLESVRTAADIDELESLAQGLRERERGMRVRQPNQSR